MLMDGVSVCMHRNLSDRHPIYKLLSPHFHYLHGIKKGYICYISFLLRFYLISRLFLVISQILIPKMLQSIAKRIQVEKRHIRMNSQIVL